MITICWDVDDTLNNITTDCFGNEIPDFSRVENDKWYRKKYLDTLDNFRKENYNKLKPNYEVRKWFIKYGHLCNNIALTSVPLSLAHFSSYWLFDYYGKWIRGFVVIPSLREGEDIPIYYESKAKWLKDIDFYAEIFIDDSEKNIKETNELCPYIKTFLVKQPWNNGIKMKKILKELTKIIKNEK